MLRREVIKMGGGLFGLGKPDPSRFPYAGRPQPAPGVAPSPGIVVRARQVIVFGPSGTPIGFFLYRAGTTPALGNPPVAWITQSNADPFGNVLPTAPGSGAVATVNNAGTRVSQLTQGAILMGLVADFTEGSLSPQSGEWIMFSPTVSGVDTPGAFHLDSALSPTGNGTTPQLKLFNGTVINANGAAVPVTGGLAVTGDATVSGTLHMNPGAAIKFGAADDTDLYRLAANSLATDGLLTTFTGFNSSGNVDVTGAGSGLKVAEGANAKQGIATLAAGTKVVANTSVTANSRIMLTAQDNNTTGALRVSARAAGASFTITSSNAADSGVVAYEIFEPG